MLLHRAFLAHGGQCFAIETSLVEEGWKRCNFTGWYKSSKICRLVDGLASYIPWGEGELPLWDVASGVLDSTRLLGWVSWLFLVVLGLEI